MANKGEINSRDILFEEALSSIKSDIRLTLTILVGFFLLALFAKFIFGISLSFFVFIILFVWVSLYFSYNYLIKRKKNKRNYVIFTSETTLLTFYC